MINGISFSSLSQDGNKNWTFQWDTVPDAPYYRIVLFGKEIGRILTTSYTFKDGSTNYSLVPPPLEIMAGDAPSLSETWPPFIQLQWYGEGADYYSVEENVAGTWMERTTVKDDGGTVFTVETPILTDGNSYLYGAQAVSQGLSSLLCQFYATMICPPRVSPTLAVDYDSVAQHITIQGG